MKKMVIFFLVLVMMISCSFLTRAQEVSVITVARKVDTKIIREDIDIPVIIGMENKQVQNEYNQLLINSINNFISTVNKEALDYYCYTLDGTMPFHQCVAIENYIVTEQDKVLSIILKYYQFTGGAHGLTTWESHNIKLDTGQDLSFAEFLSLTNLNIADINHYIKTQIQLQPQNYFTGEMGFNGVTGDQSFYINGNELVIFFQQYDIAPYVTGIPEFKISFNYR